LTDAETFAIALSTSSCATGCPAYDLKLDASGAVGFNGRGNTRQQGWSGKTVSPQVAAELLQAFRSASYWQLAAAYRTVDDGCAAVAADHATYTWNVRTEGRAKIVEDNLGCSGVPALDALRRIPMMLRADVSDGLRRRAQRHRCARSVHHARTRIHGIRRCGRCPNRGYRARCATVRYDSRSRRGLANGWRRQQRYAECRKLAVRGGSGAQSQLPELPRRRAHRWRTHAARDLCGPDEARGHGAQPQGV
jgi:hypothetical protein